MNKELDRKETQKIMKAINEQNKRKREERLLQEQKAKIAREKQAKKENVIDLITIVFMFLVLLGLFVGMLVYLHKDSEEFVKECTAAGYSETYCVSQL